MNTTEVRKVTIEELVAAFEEKYVNISPIDHYGIAIEISKGTIEYEENLKPELYFVSRDNENKVLSSICIDKDSIESIEEYNGIYTVNFILNMTSVDIAEYKALEQFQKEHEEKQK